MLCLHSFIAANYCFYGYGFTKVGMVSLNKFYLRVTKLAMGKVGGRNFGDFMVIRQIRQSFPPPKFPSIRYHTTHLLCIGPCIAIATYRPSKNYNRYFGIVANHTFVKIYSILIYSYIVDLIVGFN